MPVFLFHMFGVVFSVDAVAVVVVVDVADIIIF